jgi:hypothetical protein
MVINIYVQLILENNAFIIRNGLSKLINVDWLTNWIVNKIEEFI